MSTLERTNLNDLINKIQTDQFVIPVYQRNYTRDAKKQVKKFLDDLDNIILKKKEKHFVGIIMYIQQQLSFGENEYQIVDGQQRLVTTFLIINALVKYLYKMKDVDNAKKITNNFLICHAYNMEAKPKFKLKPLVNDDQVYQKILENEQLSKDDKKSKVYINFKYIYEHLEKRLETSTVNEVLSALNKFEIVSIPLLPTDDAQQIFESINSAGAKLETTDLIRNFILMNLPSSSQDALYTKYWKPLEKEFDKTNKFSFFIRQFLIMKTCKIINSSDLYNEFQEFWISNNISNEENSLKMMMQEIKNCGNYYHYCYIDKNDLDLPDNLVNEVSEFRKLASDPVAPLIMFTFDYYFKNKIDSETVKKVLLLINGNIIRKMFRQIPTGAITRDIPLILKDIKKELTSNPSADYYDIFVKFYVSEQTQKKTAMPTDEDILTFLPQANVYNNSYKALSIFLKRLENQENHAPLASENDLTIEHLMPETGTSYWYEKAGTNDKEKYDLLINKIGNLTLAVRADNSEMSNKNREEKKKVLEKTKHIKINEKLLNENERTNQKINERTKYLIQKIIEIYPYPVFEHLELSKYNIHLHDGNLIANAILFSDGKVFLLKDSEIDISSLISDKSITDLIEENYASQNKNVILITKDIQFENLENLHKTFHDTNENPWEKWVDDNNNPLSISIRENIKN